MKSHRLRVRRLETATEARQFQHGSDLTARLRSWELNELLKELHDDTYERQRLPPDLTPDERRESEIIIAKWDIELQQVIEEYGDILAEEPEYRSGVGDGCAKCGDDGYLTAEGREAQPAS